ncbi:MAG: hypothetical protein IPH06_13710 [Alphaproteobacteria bacterium]|nr:hypothetical protein [Alphaproteobacteria bacterium]
MRLRQRRPLIPALILALALLSLGAWIAQFSRSGVCGDWRSWEWRSSC